MLSYSFLRYNIYNLSNCGIYEEGKLLMVNKTVKEFYVSPETTQIGPYAFNSTRSTIRKVIFCGYNVQKIETHAFYYCNKLAEINLDSLINLQIIGHFAFAECHSLKSIILPESVTALYRLAFANCYNLQTFTACPNSKLRVIMDHCFQNTQIHEFTIPDSLNHFHPSCFHNLKLNHLNVSAKNRNFRLINGVIYSKFMNTVYYFPNNMTMEEYTIENGTRNIESNAFNTFNLNSLICPESLEKIHERAFVGGTMKSINFSLCKNLNHIAPRAFSMCRVEKLDFSNCTKLTKIGENAFENCYSMTSIILPDSVEIIEKYAFCHCNKLMTFSFNSTENNLSVIEKGAFFHTNLYNFTFGPNLTKISGKNFLYNCNLTTYFIHKSNQKFAAHNGVIYNRNFTKIYLYPPGKRDSSYKIHKSVVIIGQYAFASNKYLINVILPIGLTTIKRHAFESSAIYNISTPKLVNRIEKRAFADCQNLTVALIGGTYTTLPDGCFMDSINLTIISLSNSFESSPPSAFWNCKSIECASYPRGMKEKVFLSGIPWMALNHETCKNFFNKVAVKHRNYTNWYQSLFR